MHQRLGFSGSNEGNDKMPRSRFKDEYSRLPYLVLVGHPSSAKQREGHAQKRWEHIIRKDKTEGLSYIGRRNSASLNRLVVSIREHSCGSLRWLSDAVNCYY